MFPFLQISIVFSSVRVDPGFLRLYLYILLFGHGPQAAIFSLPMKDGFWSSLYFFDILRDAPPPQQKTKTKNKHTHQKPHTKKKQIKKR